MFNVSAFLNSIDSAAKETLEVPVEPTNRNRKKNEGSSHGLSRRDSDRNLPESGDAYFQDGETQDGQRSNSIDGSSHSSKAGNIPSSASGDGLETPEKPSAPIARPPSGIVNSSSKTILVATAADIDSNTRAALKKKNDEIKRLESDVSDLEQQISDLKKEVLEAWANYKQVQEKAAANEMELQEEIRQIQKAKALDKQQLLAQVTKQTEDISSLNKFISSFEKEREDMQQQLNLANEVNETWSAKVAELNEQLQEAKSSTVQGVQNLRDELRAAQSSAEQMRHDHTVILRSNEEKLSKLEKDNAEIMLELTRTQKELLSLKENGSNGESTAVDYLSRDYQQTQQEVIRLSSELQKEVDARIEAESRVRFLESEQRAVKANMEDERRRVAQTEQALLTKNSELEEKLKDLKKSMKGGVIREAVFSSELGGYLDQQPLSNDSNNGSNSSGSVVLVDGSEERIKSLENKVADLSKLLLRKQGDVVELQAERSALKSQLLDVKARCSKAEKELAMHKDLEEGEDDDFSPRYGSSHDISSSSSGGGGLSRRGSSGAGSESGGRATERDSRVIADLEKIGVKPGVGVAKAVNTIDTWAMLTGRFLRSYPLFRLGFVLYLLLLHVWVFFILLIHMERIDMDVEQQQKKLLQP